MLEFPLVARACISSILAALRAGIAAAASLTALAVPQAATECA